MPSKVFDIKRLTNVHHIKPALIIEATIADCIFRYEITPSPSLAIYHLTVSCKDETYQYVSLENQAIKNFWFKLVDAADTNRSTSRTEAMIEISNLLEE